MDYHALATEAANKYGIDPAIFLRQINQESGFNPSAHSSAGAQGIAQFMPGTAKGLGVNPLDPRSALFGAARLDARNLHAYGGDWKLALAAYNAGGGNARRWQQIPETRNYVNSILGGRSSVASAPVRSLGQPSDSAALIAEGYKALPFAADQSFGNFLSGQATLAPNSAQSGLAGYTAPLRGGSGSYKSIESLGARFGLANPSYEQTLGGKHATGSYHYQGRAVDFGLQPNGAAKLEKLAAYALQHPGQFKELYFNPLGWGIRNGVVIKGLAVPGHDDHLHIAV